MWCEQTCGPNQDQILGVEPRRNFTIDDQTHELVPLTLKITNTANCALFKSCKKIKYATQVSAMQNAFGFTTFQGAQAYLRQPVFIKFEYSDTEGIDQHYEPCDFDPKGSTFHGFPFSKLCECNSCENKCDYLPASKAMDVLEGADGIQLLIVYVIVIVLTVFLYLMKDYYKKNRAIVVANSSNDSGEEEDKNRKLNRNGENNDNNNNRNENKQGKQKGEGIIRGGMNEKEDDLVFSDTSDNEMGKDGKINRITGNTTNSNFALNKVNSKDSRDRGMSE